MRVVITGVPGTGKTTVAKKLAKATACKLIEINKLVDEHKLWKGKDKFGSRIVEIKRLCTKLKTEMKNEKNIIVEGHLACDMKLPADIAIVLRTNPKKLEARLAKRGYPREKVEENLMAEMLDYCTIKSIENYGALRVFEVETSGGNAKTMADALAVATDAKRAKKLKAGWVDWSNELFERL